MKVGFIGLGNMGAALAVGLLDHGGLEPEQVMLVNRSPGKAEALGLRYPGAEVVKGNDRLTERCDIVIVSVKADQVPEVLKEISPLGQGVHLVVTNGGLTLARMEKICMGAVSKLVPTITIEAGRGISLICHGSQVNPGQKDALEDLLGKASVVKAIPEEQFEVAADLTSCGPALIAEMMSQFAAAGVRHGGLDVQEAREMVLETMLGTAIVLKQGGTIEELQEKVATKGGITEQGLKVLDRELPMVFDHVINATMAKQASVRDRLRDKIPEQ